MERVRLVTEIEHLTPKMPERKKILKKRMYAFILDLYAIVFLNKFMVFAWLGFVNSYISNISLFNSKSSSLVNSGATNLSLPIVYTAYFFFFYYLGEGRTLGKMFFKLRVYSNGHRKEELSAKECFARALGYLLCNYMFFIPFALVYLKKDMKSIGDYLSGTTVMTDEEFAIIDTLEENISPKAEQIDMFPEDPVSNRLLKIS
ncbi:RDD family protein [Bacteriovorax sp. Seq25_V]|uniref:RDD family protein n=1 Tax=Bacteriovorax sp. Seq25_V TaxID=1201288 RepID=UPI000389E2A4|nr:RDD family protein [Bacteriovorax sp. Seq25_V]EQC45606.1 RDD family protein [Bacteriovorax sp. Seq25_V]